MKLAPAQVAGRRVQRLTLLGATGKAARLRLRADIPPVSLDVDPTVTGSNRPVVSVSTGARRTPPARCRKVMRGL